VQGAMTTTLVIPDTHFPFEDKKAWAVALKAIRDLKPNRIVIIGDFADCLTVSHFPRSPGRISNLAQEIHAVERGLDQINEVAPKAEKVYVCGNHELRLEKYLAQKAPELFGLIDFQELVKLKKRGWLWVPYRKHVTYGKIAYTHDLGYSGANAAAQCLNSFGGNIIFGHTHRAGVVYGGTVLGEHRVAMSCGWLGDPAEIDYAHQAKIKDWQQGVGIVQQDRKGNGWVQFAPIIGGQICVSGIWAGRNHQK
jgi:predicted phosphodiesterase